MWLSLSLFLFLFLFLFVVCCVFSVTQKGAAEKTEKGDREKQHRRRENLRPKCHSGEEPGAELPETGVAHRRGVAARPDRCVHGAADEEHGRRGPRHGLRAQEHERGANC